MATSTGTSTAGSLRWDVSTEAGFLACYDATFAEAYRCAARLVGGDRQRAEDLVHDSFVSLLRSARDGRLRDVGIGWVLTRVRHGFVDQARSAGREGRRLRLVADSTSGVDGRRPHEIDHDGATSNADGLLDGLPERERAALVLRYIDGLSVPEVAELLGSTVRATESLLQRAKRRARTNRREEGA